MLNLDAARALLAKLPVQDRETGTMVPFTLRLNQGYLHEKVKKHQARIDGKIRVICVKARRVGGSSWAEGIGTCHIAARANATAWIVACLSETSEELFRVPTDLVENWPFPLPKPLTTYITYPHKGGDSYMSIATAKSVASGRGPTLSFLHLSEAAFYPSGKSFMSLLPSVSDDPDTAIIVESTANGKVGQGAAFWKMWEAATRGESEFLAVFLTWLNDPTCRRDPAEGYKFRDAKEEEKGIIAICACSDRCERCEHCYKAKSCIAWRSWALYNICQGKVDEFHREYPITADEAFYSTSFPAFSADEIRLAYKSVRDPLKTGRLEIDTSSYGQSGTNEPKFVDDPRSPLLVWAEPHKDYHYYIGADCARGMGGDYTAINVFCGQNGEQVARYANRHTDPESLAKLLNLLGNWYNYAMINIELTGNLGLWAQKVLRDTHLYRNLYRWRGRDDKLPGPRPYGSIGWETTQRTRDLMLSAFRGGIAHGRLKIRDAALVAQMDSAEMLDGRWQVPEDIHDDLMVSSFIAWVAKEQWHNGTLINTGKQLLGDEVQTSDDLNDAKREVHNAKGDVQASVRAHWAKMLKTIKSQGRMSQIILVSEPGKQEDLSDRLRGI